MQKNKANKNPCISSLQLLNPNYVEVTCFEK